MGAPTTPVRPRPAPSGPGGSRARGAVRRTLLRRSWGRYGLRGGSLTAALGLWQLLTTLGISLWLRFAWFPSAAYVVREFAERGGVGVCW